MKKCPNLREIFCVINWKFLPTHQYYRKGGFSIFPFFRDIRVKKSDFLFDHKQIILKVGYLFFLSWPSMVVSRQQQCKKEQKITLRNTQVIYERVILVIMPSLSGGIIPRPAYFLLADYFWRLNTRSRQNYLNFLERII